MSVPNQGKQCSRKIKPEVAFYYVSIPKQKLDKNSKEYEIK